MDSGTAWFESIEISSSFFFFFQERTRIPSIRDRNKLEIHTSWAAAKKPSSPDLWRPPYLTPSSSRTLFSSVSDSKVSLLTPESSPPFSQSLSSPAELSALAHHPGLTDSGYLCMAVMAGHLGAPSSDFHNLVFLSDTPMLLSKLGQPHILSVFPGYVVIRARALILDFQWTLRAATVSRSAFYPGISTEPHQCSVTA